MKRAQQLAILRYARGPYQPASPAPTYDVGIPQGIVSIFVQNFSIESSTVFFFAFYNFYHFEML